MAEVLRGVYTFPNVRRAPGNSGKLKRYGLLPWRVLYELIRAYVRSFKTEIMKTSTYLYLDNDQKAIPWATSMVIQVCTSARRENICLLS